MSPAAFSTVSDGVFIRIGKGKELVGKVEGQMAHFPPIKRVYVPEGCRAQVVYAVHEATIPVGGVV